MGTCAYSKDSNHYNKVNNTWVTHQMPPSTIMADKLIQIKDSIWYSTPYESGESGMVEYCLTSNTVKQIVKYPFNIQPFNHVACSLNDLIYIINGAPNTEIIVFDPCSLQFSSKGNPLKDKIGAYPSVIDINDKLYIYNGSHNKSLSYIYNPETNESKTNNDDFALYRICNVAIIKYETQIFRFGGLTNANKAYLVDWFLIDDSTIGIDALIVAGYIRTKCDHEYPPSDILGLIFEFYHVSRETHELDNCSDARLPFKMYLFGYILYRHYIIIFGGKIGLNEFLDSIFILDLYNKDKGWIESDVRCPKKNGYKAILTSNNDIHLFASDWLNAGHWSMPVALLFTD